MSVFSAPKLRRMRLDKAGAVSTAVVLLVVLVLWDVGVRLSGTSANVLPAPSAIVFEADWSLIFSAATYTTVATLAGFVVGNLTGLVLAIAISASRLVSDLIFPLAITIRSVPIVALAPFITLAFGRGPASSVVVSALIVFFPTLINVILGLRSVPREALELTHVINASAPFTYLKVRLPFTAPAFFSALKIAAPGAVLGVMTAEWIIGGQGLGRLVIQSWLTLNIPTMWGAVALSTAVAAIMFTLVSIAEKLVISWAVRT